MASLVDAVPQVNGLAEPSPTSPPSPQSQSQAQSESSQSANAPAKRKRESSDDGSAELNDAAADDDEAKPVINGDQPVRDEATLIRNYFEVIQRYDTTPSVLKRPLLEPSASEEPQSKRQKSDHDTKNLCIQDKVDRDSYKLLDHLVLDLKQAIQDRAVEMQSAQSTDGTNFDDNAFIELANLKEKALELHGREMTYPYEAPSASHNGPGALDGIAQKPSNENTVLTIFGSAPQPKHLFSSLPKREPISDHSEGRTKPLPDVPLPGGVSTTTVLPTSSSDNASRVPTLGELFPSPSNLPPLQPPKAPKTATKSKVLGFHHPELAERSRYRQGSYFSTDLSTGAWLDYSNATPPSKNRSRQRERTLSLAGQKPSTADLEMSEMETLFRGAFSSFAPEKDDSGAIIPSGEVARVWYQRQGHRYMQQMIESELAVDADDEADQEVAPLLVNEDEIAEAIENWEDYVDPRLTIDDVLGKKSDEEKEIDDTLQEISDLIETLASYQRNRNMALPTSQNRNSADPAKTDMLNGSLAQEPTDEERDTYQMLKDQLAIIIQGLPPYAVARLNSDKLEGLNVSTKLEVRSDVYKGVMEEDEASARLKHQQQAAVQASQTPRQPQRTPSFQGGTPYQQYNRPFPVQNQTPVPIPNHYQQSPMRPQIPPNYQRQVSAPMPGMQPQQHRPPPGQPFARPNGYIPQPMQQRPYGTPGAVPPYPASPGQQRIPAGYPAAPPPGTPGQRYPSSYAGYNPQQQQPGMQPQYHQQPGGFAPHINGAGSMPPRTMSPQVPQYQATPSYSPRAGPQAVPRPQPYVTPGQPGVHPGIPRFPSNGVQQNPPQSPAPGGPPGGWVNPISPQRQYEQQLQARNQAAARLNAYTEKVAVHHAHGVSGLGGIGLGGAPVDMAKLAQMRANMPGGVGHTSPSPRPISSGVPAGMNGVPQPSPSPASVPGATPSPAPSANLPSQAPA
ncbi:hypothetical protein VP1G_08857 [Cytospora mali]|uniref:Uncharacterized protein n=1 Tax=Cytospora mali TaxID=578113 RepID=A0A194VD43_CYTMA|nr:hypothetical protein VP1G_08857 [Valsa mali var. pyri (nom. inval.)]